MLLPKMRQREAKQPFDDKQQMTVSYALVSLAREKKRLDDRRKRQKVFA